MRRSVCTSLMLVWMLAMSSTYGANRMESLTLRKSEQELREIFLAQTPLGSSSDSVLQKLYEAGYVPERSNHGLFQLDAERNVTTLGVSSISVKLGDYWSFPFVTTNVTAYWAFDANQRLLDVQIWKSADGP